MNQIRIVGIAAVGMALGLASMGAMASTTCQGRAWPVLDAAQMVEIEKAANAGDHFAEAQMAVSYLRVKRQPHRDQGMMWLNRSVAGGNAEGQKLLADDFSSAPQSKDDMRRAAALYEQAMNQGCLEAKMSLSSMMIMGVGIPKNVEAGNKMITDTAESGFPPAMVVLGMMKIDGEGMKKDPKAGFDLTKRAEETGYPGAKLLLAMYYFEGVGTAKDFKQGYRVLESMYDVPDDGFHSMAFATGMMILQEKEHAKMQSLPVINWTLKAANLGVPEAKQTLDEMMTSLPKRKIKNSCKIYADVPAVASGQPLAQVDKGEVVAVLAKKKGLDEAYFPDRKLAGVVAATCVGEG